MIIRRAFTSISWIPSESVEGFAQLAFESGVLHYDRPLPDRLSDGDIELLRDADRFRFANRLRAWIEVDGGVVTGYGYAGGPVMGSTTVRLGAVSVNFGALALPPLQAEPQVGDGWVRFAQTCGGRSGVPAPRPVSHPPFVQLASPVVWTTLALTIHADGRCEHEVLGASDFPRHWFYDDAGTLVAKSGLLRAKDWIRTSFGPRTPWGDQDSPALVMAAETALERRLSTEIMGDPRRRIRCVAAGSFVVEQGEPGDELFLLLDGVLTVEVDGAPVAEIGPGAVVGERALLDGRRAATLRARTLCKVAAVRAPDVPPALLGELAGHGSGRAPGSGGHTANICRMADVPDRTSGDDRRGSDDGRTGRRAIG